MMLLAKKSLRYCPPRQRPAKRMTLTDSVLPHVSRTVDFVVRSDAFVKPGGDTHQVERYAVVLRKLGYDVEIFEHRETLKFRSGSIVHIVNVDRPYDFLSAIRLAKGHKVVVSSIHHDLDNVREMRMAEKGQGLRSFVGRVLSESGREFLAYAVRSRRQVTSVRSAALWMLAMLRATSRVRQVWRLTGRALEDVAAVTLLAKGEGVSLESDTGWSGHNGVIIPNGIPDHAESAVKVDWASRTVDLCVVGRIEPRKRSVEVATAAHKLGLNCVFVGPASPSAPAYASDFSEYVGTSPHITWLGPRSHSEVQDLLGDSKVLVNASWVEVQSLVDIEAARSGCWVVTGRGGNSAEWMVERLISVDTHDVDRILLVASQIVKDGVPPSGELYSQTWDESGSALATVYEA